ncbi:MAG: hypothetical protein ABJF23_27560 [Bryobacteraceae bacterium]
MTIEDRELAVYHVIYEYANLISSGEMVTTGQHLGKCFDPPINTHLADAFYFSCRKMADFFLSRSKEKDDVFASHYVSTVTFDLPVHERWRTSLQKQLAHLTYWRDKSAEEIEKPAQAELFNELKTAWVTFLQHLPEPYRTDFDTAIIGANKKQGFEHLDLR